MDPLSSYEREVPKFVGDARVLGIPKHLRREAFEVYSRANELSAIEGKEAKKEKAVAELGAWMEGLLEKEPEFDEFEDFQLKQRQQP